MRPTLWWRCVALAVAGSGNDKAPRTTRVHPLPSWQRNPTLLTQPHMRTDGATYLGVHLGPAPIGAPHRVPILDPLGHLGQRRKLGVRLLPPAHHLEHQHPKRPDVAGLGVLGVVEHFDRRPPHRQLAALHLDVVGGVVRAVLVAGERRRHPAGRGGRECGRAHISASVPVPQGVASGACVSSACVVCARRARSGGARAAGGTKVCTGYRTRNRTICTRVRRRAARSVPQCRCVGYRVERRLSVVHRKTTCHRGRGGGAGCRTGARSAVTRGSASPTPPRGSTSRAGSRRASRGRIR